MKINLNLVICVLGILAHLYVTNLDYYYDTVELVCGLLLLGITAWQYKDRHNAKKVIEIDF